MTTHPNRSTKMHHFTVDADAKTGEWMLSTLTYTGTVEAAAFYALSDTASVHYDQADPEAFPCFAEAADVEIGKRNVALTMNLK
jgi:hypothetical protein